ncbi:MAG: DUF4276 family protein [Mycobacterium sp.]|nr:DUF4276 family protein [Mycobacterium sp.]
MSDSACPVIAPIIEGKGEQDAIGVLIRKIAEAKGFSVQVAQPFRVDSAKMRRPDELQRAVRMQSARVDGRGGVLIVRDGDDKDVTCVVELADELATAASSAGAKTQVVVAAPEYEAWILASIETVGRHRLITDSTPILDPEARRGAAEWMAGKTGDRPTSGQPGTQKPRMARSEANAMERSYANRPFAEPARRRGVPR